MADYNWRMAEMLDPHQWQQSGQWFEFDGLRLFISDQGRGQAVLTLHAFPTSSYDFTRLVPLLYDRFRFILFDYPGFGFSDKPPEYPYSLFKYAAAAQAVAQRFSLEHVCLVGHDIGASVALEILCRGQPVIDRLILLNGSVWSIPFEDRKMRLMQRTLLHPIGGPLIMRLGLFNQRRFAGLLRGIWGQALTAEEIEAFWSILRYQHGDQLYARLMRYMLERWQYQRIWLEALQRHHAPLTLIWGMADPVATPAVADVVMQYRSDAALITLPGVGHYPQWEASESVAAALASALM
jgi:pimeloyl-ACP methyl ester carboxylesterase